MSEPLHPLPASTRSVPAALRRLAVAWRLHVGRPGLVGLAGLLVALYLVGIEAPSLKQRQAELAQRLALQQEEAARTPATRSRPARLAAVSNAIALLESLPPPSQRGADLTRLVELAVQQKVELARGDYAVERLDGTADAAVLGDEAISQWRLQLPVRGSYAQLRRFAAEMLNTMPHVALDGLQIDRPDTQQADLETTLRITFFYRGRA
ncbi:GspMb/PilO family protein [Leptothrix discophora]|uniref:GspMb/PilO family protein n=1 Tax=Leptothrix discophora TaxID=89 RepID=A0ABT9G229_LEPDI|nr:GspMb/PilO family protein [Leptothrix discophora]MDP4300545.1 GspMb/PilO family protein [Leptothrix discophora]